MTAIQVTEATPPRPPLQLLGPAAAWIRRRTAADGVRATSHQLRTTLHPCPQSVSRARHAAGEWLADRGLGDDDLDDVVLMVDELVTNAVQHGEGPVRLRLRLRPGRSVTCHVTDHSDRLPQPQRSDAATENGRGLFLIKELSDAYGARLTRTGKIVWFRRRIRTGMRPDAPLFTKQEGGRPPALFHPMTANPAAMQP